METHRLFERESKALAIATHTQLVRKPNNAWIVPSQSGPKTYTVNPDPELRLAIAGILNQASAMQTRPPG